MRNDGALTPSRTPTRPPVPPTLIPLLRCPNTADIFKARIGYTVKRSGLGIPERVYSWHPTLAAARRAARRWCGHGIASSERTPLESVSAPLGQEERP